MNTAVLPRAGVNLAAVNAPASTVLLGECTGVSAEILHSPERIDTGSPPLNAASTILSPVGLGLWGYDAPGYNRTKMLYQTGLMGDSVALGATGLYKGGAAAVGLHTNGANYLLADGHVKWLLAGAVSTGGTPAATTCAQGAAGCQTASVGVGYTAAGTSGLTANSGNFAATFSPL